MVLCGYVCSLGPIARDAYPSAVHSLQRDLSPATDADRVERPG